MTATTSADSIWVAGISPVHKGAIATACVRSEVTFRKLPEKMIDDSQTSLSISVNYLTVPADYLLYYSRWRKSMSTKCRYCGSTSYGSGCYHSPTGKHEHRDDEKHCEYCGSSSYGSGCYHSPTKKHRHGPGGNKCIWCGSTSNGSGCIHSPTGKHEK